jgi:O-antigen/teichoic acid export membrane protein
VSEGSEAVWSPADPAANPSFRRSTSQLLVGFMANQVAMGIAFLLLARISGPRTTGEVSALFGALTVGTDVVDFGMNGWLQRALASRQNITPAYVTNIRLFKLYASLVVSAATIITIYVIHGPHWLAFLPVWFILACQQQTLVACLSGQFKFSASATAPAIDRGSTLATMLLLLAAGVTAAPAFCVALCVGSLLASTFAHAAGGSIGPLRLGKPRIAQLPRSGGFALSSIFSDLQLGDSAVVAASVGPAIAGMFAIPARLTGPLGVLPTAISQVLLSHASRGLAEVERARRLLTWSFALFIVVYSSAGFIGYMLIVPVLGRQYSGARDAVFIFCAITAVSATNQLLSSWLQSNRKEHQVALIVSVCMVAQLTALAIVPRYGGVTGASLCFAGMQVIIFTGLSRHAQLTFRSLKASK